MTPDDERDWATIELVLDFCARAKGPQLSRESAALVAVDLNQALFRAFYWQKEYAKDFNDHPGRQRMRLVAHSLKTLQSLLPVILDETRNTLTDHLSTDCGPTITDDLLSLVNQHQHIIDAFPPSGQGGRPPVPETAVSAYFSRRVFDLWGEGSGREKKNADAFAQIAMGWLTQRPVPPTLNAIAKKRTHKP